MRVRLTLLALLTWSAAASAQPEPAAARAARLFQEGRALSEQLDFAAACGRFEQSLALDSASGTELNLGDCYEHLARFADAWRHFDDATTKLAAEHDPRAPYARTRRDALGARVAVIAIRDLDPRIRVVIAGREQPLGSQLDERVDPGDIEVRIGDETRHVHADAAATVVIDAATRSPGRPAERHQRIVLAEIVGGVGALTGAIALGVVLEARARYAGELSNGDCVRNDGAPVCNPEGLSRQQSAITLADAGTGLAIAAVLALGGGAALYFTAPHAQLEIAPSATATSVGVTMRGCF
jgi:hypothetical protein